MIRPGALSLYQQILYDIFILPAGATVWRLMSKGRAKSLGTSDSEVAKGWTNSAFLILMALVYLVMFAITIYGYFA